MINNSILFKKFFIILFIFIQYEIYSQELSEVNTNTIENSDIIPHKIRIIETTTNVFCAKEDKSFKWLEEENKSVTVSGERVHYDFIMDNNEKLSLFYFKLRGGKNKHNKLKTKCISKFGNEYIYAQPAIRYGFSVASVYWHVFGGENGMLFDGIFESHLIVDKNALVIDGAYMEVKDSVNIWKKVPIIVSFIKSKYIKNDD